MKLTTDSFLSLGFFFIVVGLGIIMIVHDPELNKYALISCVVGAGLMMVSYQQNEAKERECKPVKYQKSYQEPNTVQLLDKNGNILATESIDNVKKLR